MIFIIFGRHELLYHFKIIIINYIFQATKKIPYSELIHMSYVVTGEQTLFTRNYTRNNLIG